MDVREVQKHHLKDQQLQLPVSPPRRQTSKKRAAPAAKESENAAAARELEKCCARVSKLQAQLMTIARQDLRTCKKSITAGNQLSRIKKYLKECGEAANELEQDLKQRRVRYSPTQGIYNMARGDQPEPIAIGGGPVVFDLVGGMPPLPPPYARGDLDWYYH